MDMLERMLTLSQNFGNENPINYHATNMSSDWPSNDNNVFITRNYSHGQFNCGVLCLFLCFDGRFFLPSDLGSTPSDCPNDFKLKRDRIAEKLFTCKVTKYFGCDKIELSVPMNKAMAAHLEALGYASEMQFQF